MTEAFSLTPAARQTLLARARDAVRRTVGGPRDADGDSPPAESELDRPGAAFVTLHVGGHLRGCIGTCEAIRPLWQVVDEMATAAATRDPRFPALVAADLRSLTVEISVLSPQRRIDSPAEIEIGRHGLEIRCERARGLLLPQVAVEHELDRDRFLAETCRKAGLDRNAWRDPATEIRVFEASVFGDGGA